MKEKNDLVPDEREERKLTINTKRVSHISIYKTITKISLYELIERVGSFVSESKKIAYE